jgi:site-specific DNA recombinase
VNVEHLERGVLAAIRDYLIQPEAIEAFNQEFKVALKDRQSARRRLQTESRKQIRETEAKIARIVEAIAEGTSTPAIRTSLLEHEAKLLDLTANAEAHKDAPEAELFPDLADLYRGRLEEMAVALSDPACRPEAIHLIRGLIERFVLRPAAIGRGLKVEIVGQMAALAEIARGVGPASPDAKAAASKRTVSMASPTGFEPVLPT